MQTPSAALFDLGERDRVRIVGPDAAGFLDRLLTLAVQALPVGHGSRAFLLDAKGRVRLAFHLLRERDASFLVDAAPGHGPEVVQALDMFHFGEALAFEPIEPGALGALGLHGADAGATLDALTLPRPAAHGAHVSAEGPDGVALTVIRLDRTGQPGYEVLGPPGAIDALRAGAVAHGAQPSPTALLDAMRIAAGVPGFPGEYGEHATPLDVGTMDGITDAKGCYPGQEVIERTIAIGRPARRLVRVRLDQAVETPAEVKLDGKVIGRLTSVGELDGAVHGLALIKRRHADGAGPWVAGEATVTPIAVSESKQSNG